MADIKTITKLREQTGAGMMDCKKALTEAGDDYDKAIEILRKKGEAKAAKKADRDTKEGLIAMMENEKEVAVVGLACETDFVARNEDSKQAVEDYARDLLNSDADDFKARTEAKIKNELVVKIGENIQLSIVEKVAGEVIGTYLHSNKKVASVVVLNGGTSELAGEIAMQVAAMDPEYLNPEDVPAEVIEKEKDVYREQLKNEGKPEEMIEKILVGKLNKFYEEICLTKQAFIKDDKKKVEDYIKEQAGDDVKIEAYYRFSV